MQQILTQYFHSSEAFCQALAACHRDLTPQNVASLEASQARYRREAQRLEAATLDLHPVEKMGVAALLEAQMGASQGIVSHNRSRLIRQDAEARLRAGDSDGAKKLEAEADALELQVEGLADPVFTAQALSEAVGEVLVAEVRP